ncbi:MAG: cysteine dioxygenase [Acidimicrobiales bacterium]
MTIIEAAAGRPRPPQAPFGAGLGAGVAAGVNPPELLALVRSYATEFEDRLPGARPHLSARSYELLELTDDLEIWAIHWPKDHGLELHDHGGSSGALWVVRGALEEHGVGPAGQLVRRRIGRGDGAAFGPTYVHDVVNAEDAPATSLHLYAPPMASMTFYRRQGAGLVVERAEYRADPTWAP